jgi:hypothetical protein
MNKWPFIAAVIFISCSVGLFWSSPSATGVLEELPARLSDEMFWQLSSEFSEPGGYFRSDNFVSNEETFQFVISDLKKNTKPGGVYLGVGPDQNFTYIIALQPRMAFIFDIRRQNMMEHLMYKALIEMSSDRVDFASRLFSRKRPADLTASVTPEALFQAYDSVPPDTALYESNLKAMLDHLEKDHGFALSMDDEQSVEYVYRAFFEAGPQINYSFSAGGRGRSRMPAYEDLMVSGDFEGVNRSYMANDENFQQLKTFEKANRIVPVVGDFAGDKAIRSVAKYLQNHDATVTAFYLSNVEQYLFQDRDSWKRFYSNVAALPLDSSSTFIRSYFTGSGIGYINGGYSFMRSQNLLCPIANTLKAFGEGRIAAYSDLMQTCTFK